MLVKSIISKLKEGSIKNVVLFSNGMKLPPPPYVVVKPEAGVIKNTRSFRITAHMEKGHFDDLNNYTLVELDNLLLSDYLKDDEGGIYRLYANGYTDITAEPESDTYYMEKMYYTPMTIR